MSDRKVRNMAAGDCPPAEAQGNFFDLLTPPPARPAESALMEPDELELAELQERLTMALKQARKGKLAASSGEESIRQAFAAAKR